jgi:hypothetical protein
MVSEVERPYVQGASRLDPNRFKFSSLLPTFLIGRGNLSSPLPEEKRVLRKPQP